MLQDILIIFYPFLGHHLFSLSVRGNCKNPVNSKNKCKEAAKFINSKKNVTFTKATGKGHDLPYGCIFYTKMINSWQAQHYIFWNPNGAALSFDDKIQQVCYELEKSFAGNIFFVFQICRIKLIE